MRQRAGRLRTRITIAAVLAAAAVAAFWPLPGPTPMRCTYDGDSGVCAQLFYRSTVTVAVANLMWGADVVQGPR